MSFEPPVNGVRRSGISGEKNPSAFYFCERENFNYSFFKVANKINALNFICEKENIKHAEVAYFFDDVLDLSMAEVCGVRILISIIRSQYPKENQIVYF